MASPNTHSVYLQFLLPGTRFYKGSLSNVNLLMNLQKARSGKVDCMIGGILQFIFFFFSLFCLFQGFGIFNNHVLVSCQSLHPGQQRMELPHIPPRVFQMPMGDSSSLLNLSSTIQSPLWKHLDDVKKKMFSLLHLMWILTDNFPNSVF